MYVLSEIGFVHLLASVIALITGTIVLLSQKGTLLHKRVGYGYAASMIVLLVTAFMLYRLFGRFGIFHIAAVVSTITLIGGMIPVLLRKPRGSYLDWHFNFMYWSVIGLYAAFAAEVLVRVPGGKFFTMVGFAAAAVGFTGGVLHRKFFKPRWQKLVQGTSEPVATG